jgi:hypothetical protein
MKLWIGVVLGLLWCTQAVAQETVRLAKEKDEVRSLALAPQGEAAAWTVVDPKGKRTLYGAPLSGKAPKAKKLGAGLVADVRAQREELLYYVESPDTGVLQLALIALDGKGQRALVDVGLDPTTSRAVWSPDGGVFVAVTDRGALSASPEGQARFLGPTRLINPQWSPDAQHVLYERPGGGLTLLALDDLKTFDLTPPGVGLDARLSPDGASALYAQDGQIELVELDSTQRRKLAPGVGAWWTHAGLGILFVEDTGKTSALRADATPAADLRLRWLNLKTGDTSVLVERAHELRVDRAGRHVLYSVQGDGVFLVTLPELPGEPEARAALPTPSKPRVPAKPDDKKPGLPTSVPRHPIKPDVLKAIQ